MHEAAFAHAALPAPAVVLGMALRPYSLGHELFLIRQENPLAIAGKPATPEQLERALPEAVLLCCQTHEECAGMNADWLIGLKLRLWRRRIRKLNLTTELTHFLNYRAAGALSFRPSDRTVPGRESARVSGAPEIARLLQFLITKFGKTEPQAWDYPYGLARMQFAAFWEAEGAYEIYNEHDGEHDAFVAEQEAKARGATCPA